MTLDEMLQPGISLRIYYYPGNINNTRLHIRAVVDDDWFVYREWWRSKQRWHYAIEHRYFFEMRHADGHLRYVGRTDREEG